MNKRVLLLLLAFALVIVGIFFKTFISASIFDTHAVAEQTAPNITIDAFPPDMIIVSPTNTTYTTAEISLEYSVSDSYSGVDTVWYNLDSGSNTSITSNTTLTLTRGSYNLYIFANDSVGLENGSESVTFTVSVEAPPPPVTARAAEAGVGTGGKRLMKKDFVVDPQMLKLQFKRGDRLRKTVKVENTGESPLKVTLSVEKLESFVFLPEESFTLNPGESKGVGLEFVSSAQPGVYTGRIVLESEGIQRIIAVIIEVESDKILYDATLDIPAKYTKLKTERELPLTVTIFNIAGPKTAEVELEYLIINKEAEVIVREGETVTVNEQASFTKTLTLPQDMPYGEYVAVLIVKYGESVGTSSRVFEVARPSEELSLLRQGVIKNVLIIGIAIILILSFVVFSSSYIQHKRLRNIEEMQAKRLPQIYERYKTKALVQETKEKEKEKAKELLEKEQKSLDDALKLNCISQDSYQKAKKRINDILKKIK